jgi:hypothetical protein
MVVKPNMGPRYFSYDLIAAVNDWIPQTKANRARAERQFPKTVERYHRELDKLKHRVGVRAWQFFRYGFGPTGLHDGRLLSMCIGDGVDYKAEGKTPFRLNRQKLVVRLEFLNYEQEFHYLFELRGVSGVCSNLFPGGPSHRSVGDLYTCEIVGINDDHLQLSLLFASRATIILQFSKLLFRRRRIDRRYGLSEIYG